MERGTGWHAVAPRGTSGTKLKLAAISDRLSKWPVADAGGDRPEAFEGVRSQGAARSSTPRRPVVSPLARRSHHSSEAQAKPGLVESLPNLCQPTADIASMFVRQLLAIDRGASAAVVLAAGEDSAKQRSASESVRFLPVADDPRAKDKKLERGVAIDTRTSLHRRSLDAPHSR